MNRPVEWPEPNTYGCEACCPPVAWCDVCRMNFEAHTKVAAMQRLRILQRAAIRFMASDIANKHADYGCVDAIAEALEKVGPLPELPAMGDGK